MDQPVDNKTALIVVAAVIILVGGVWYFGSQTVASYAPTATAAVGSSLPTSGKAPIYSFLTLPGSHECSVTIKKATPVSGTIDVSSGEMSGTFMLTVNGKPTAVHIINDGTTIYAWSDATTKGIELPVTPSLQMTSLSYAGITLATSVTYTCTTWVPTQGAFTPDSAIRFKTIGSNS